MPDGNVERGTARQRHIARQINSLKGVNIVISHRDGTIPISVEDGAEMSKLRNIVEDADASIKVESDGFTYSTGGLAMQIAVTP